MATLPIFTILLLLPLSLISDKKENHAVHYLPFSTETYSAVTTTNIDRMGKSIDLNARQWKILIHAISIAQITNKSQSMVQSIDQKKIRLSLEIEPKRRVLVDQHGFILWLPSRKVKRLRTTDLQVISVMLGKL